MKQVYMIIFCSLLLISCGKKTTTYVTREPAIVDAIEEIVNRTNEDRQKQGLLPLTNGLTCSLSTFTSGDRIQAAIPGHATLSPLVVVANFTYKGIFEQFNEVSAYGVNILPQALQETYIDHYLLRCQGYLVIEKSDFYSFDLSSDDASILYLDNIKLIDLDGAHGSLSVGAAKYLAEGVHAFRVDYADIGGSHELQVFMNNTIITSNLFYR